MVVRRKDSYNRYLIILLLLFLFFSYFHIIFKIKANLPSVNELDIQYRRYQHKPVFFPSVKQNFIEILISWVVLKLFTIFCFYNKEKSWTRKVFPEFIRFIRKRLLLLPRFNGSRYKALSHIDI